MSLKRKKEKEKRLLKEKMNCTKEGVRDKTPKERPFLKEEFSQYKFTTVSLTAPRETAAISTA